ncbi:Protein Wnt-3a, partial [Chelonia mydas]
LCGSIPGLVPKQLRFCRNYVEIMPSVAEGVKIGIQECQHQFRGRRWNCTTVNDSLAIFGPVLDKAVTGNKQCKEQSQPENCYVFSSRSLAIGHQYASLGTQPVLCGSIPGLVPKQLRFCRNYVEIMPSVAEGVKIGIQECQHHIPGLVPKQLRFCRNYVEIMPSVAEGVKIGIQECQHQFRGRRWNCTTVNDSLAIFGPVLDKERPSLEQRGQFSPNTRSALGLSDEMANSSGPTGKRTEISQLLHTGYQTLLKW